MITTDKMGGFIAARIIETGNIESFVVSENGVRITPKAGKTFFKLDVIKNGIVPNFSPSVEKAGHLLTISVNITLREPSELTITPFNKFLLIITNPMGKEFVCGTKQFPLTCIRQPIASANAAGQSGEMLRFEGKQPDSLYYLKK